MSKDDGLRVLHTEWSGGWGGQEVRIFQEMIAMREQGVDVFMACTAHARLNDKCREAGIPTFNLPFKGNWDFETLRGLIKIIREHRINIVNTHSGKDTWVGGFAAKLTRTRFIRTRHLSNPVNKSPLNFINKMADYVITTGESVRQAMIHDNRIRPNKIISIPTGVDELRFDPSKFDRDAERGKFGIATDELAIGIVAILRGFKRHDLFIEMAKTLVKQLPKQKLKFIIAGDGPREAQIKELIENSGIADQINMIGYQENPEHILSALDIFVLSSDGSEGVPQSVMQALMMQKAVVATDAGSTEDLYHEDNFVLTKSGDLQALIEDVQHLAEDAELRAYYANQARDYVVKHFSKRVMVEKLMQIYQKIYGLRQKIIFSATQKHADRTMRKTK